MSFPDKQQKHHGQHGPDNENAWKQDCILTFPCSTSSSVTG